MLNPRKLRNPVNVNMIHIYFVMKDSYLSTSTMENVLKLMIYLLRSFIIRF